jgi:DNA polymerase-3 subunit gamma/tau
MDAASHTGVDNMREIIDAVRYASVSARYKIYIIDEVHMLSKGAFNALLKTLEEPPEHVKFLFATTEVNKVPVTVLSRTQRFDLRRIDPEKLVAHFAEVARSEGVEIEADALAMIARAAEGSARDGLSILDQAIAHGGGTVTAEQVRDMLGLADRGRVRDLLELVLAGDSTAALKGMDEAHDLGMDPASIIRGLMEALHSATRAKAGAQTEALLSAEQRDFSEKLADRLTWGQIHRLWQMLLKGLSDVTIAPDPQEAATMAILRLIHAAELPDPASLLQQLGGGAGAPTIPPPAPKSVPSAPSAQFPPDFSGLIRAIEAAGKHQLAIQLHDQVGLVRYSPPELAVKPLRPLGSDWPRELASILKGITGANWTVTIADEGAEPSLLEQEKMAEEQVRADILQDPSVKAAMDAFPDAELESYSLTKGA